MDSQEVGEVKVVLLPRSVFTRRGYAMRKWLRVPLELAKDGFIETSS